MTRHDCQVLPDGGPRWQLVDGEFHRGPEKEVYARFGVTELWLIDPDTPQIEVYRLPEDSEVPQLTLRKHQTLTTPLFPGLVIQLEQVFHR
jgi:Uma2 family endonuclease